MTQITETEGRTYNRGKRAGPLYGVIGVVGINDLRNQVWTGYPRDVRKPVVEVLDQVLKDVGRVARKGGVVRSTGAIDPLDSLSGKSDSLDTDLARKGLVVMQVGDLEEKYDLRLRRGIGGYHRLVWLSVVAPDLVSGLSNKLDNRGIEMGFRDEPGFDQTLAGLARYAEDYISFGLPVGARLPFSGREIVNVRLLDLIKERSSVEN